MITRLVGALITGVTVALSGAAMAIMAGWLVYPPLGIAIAFATAIIAPLAGIRVLIGKALD